MGLLHNCPISTSHFAEGGVGVLMSGVPKEMTGSRLHRARRKSGLLAPSPGLFPPCYITVIMFYYTMLEYILFFRVL